jgi:hypothetical protein
MSKRTIRLLYKSEKNLLIWSKKCSCDNRTLRFRVLVHRDVNKQWWAKSQLLRYKVAQLVTLLVTRNVFVTFEIAVTSNCSVTVTFK